MSVACSLQGSLANRRLPTWPCPFFLHFIQSITLPWCKNSYCLPEPSRRLQSICRTWPWWWGTGQCRASTGSTWSKMHDFSASGPGTIIKCIFTASILSVSPLSSVLAFSSSWQCGSLCLCSGQSDILAPCAPRRSHKSETRHFQHLFFIVGQGLYLRHCTSSLSFLFAFSGAPRPSWPRSVNTIYINFVSITEILNIFITRWCKVKVFSSRGINSSQGCPRFYKLIITLWTSIRWNLHKQKLKLKIKIHISI